MDSDRPHRTTSINSSSGGSNTTGELFICFTSRLSSSSSMKISKSILSPGRARDHQTPQISLSSSLSRRLRSNGSLKGAGQASPMFPTNGKKRGSAFENPEPSSPKVTCIGQVRVKTKKQGKKLRARSKRGGGGGEVSFRKLEISNGAPSTEATQSFYFQNQQGNNQECLPHRNQRWVHFPVTICEALRTFGSDWNCFLPCRSSCMSKEEKTEGGANNGENGHSGNHNSSSCGAVIARWLVALQEGEGRGREVEIIVGDEERTAAAAAADAAEGSGSYRRRAFEGIEFNEEEICRERSEVEEDDGGGRASVSIPPKNALLLMRCRSDPVKMAALASRFCEAPPVVVDGNDEDENQSENFVASGCENEGVEVKKGGEVEHEMDDDKEEEVSEKWISAEASWESRLLGESSLTVEERGEYDQEEVNQEVNVLEEQLDQKIMEEEDEEEVKEVLVLEEEGGEVKELMEVTSQVVTTQETEVRCFAVADGENLQLSVQDHTYTEEGEAHHEHGVESDDGDHDNDVLSAQLNQESGGDEDHEIESRFHVELVAPTEEAVGLVDPEAQVTVPPHERSESNGLKPPWPEGKQVKSTEREGSQQKSVLPDCLLLMMCEPKLSMEVSKETWVCSTDFIRWLPERQVGKIPVKTDGGKDEPKKRAGNAESKRSASALTAQQAHILQQPRRNSCSLPPRAAARATGAESMATMIEQKLESAKAREPFVLTRCKSEPMQSATKLAPDACFWKNRKLEPHRPATHGVKAAGVGF
ncbi:uncharacterized protein LOC115755033 [Rhodamnia argentea]|uniref:Uncharacterized protein LOC115755033 n=1 Tax=Rhodamnia argentea TaxID=178133 RepID=A0A8B8QUU5_9MYRT|nr:uncharacterized protein LOC115755033 [Rhodamnia argentea]